MNAWWHGHAEPLGEQPEIVPVGRTERVAEVMAVAIWSGSEA